MNKKCIIVIILIFFLTLKVMPQEAVRDINYQTIKLMIQSGDLDKALIDTEELLRENPGDATLALYQAEIWLNKGERLYQKRKYKSALVEFEKVYKVWNNHTLVRQRYLELKDKNPLVDYQDENVNMTPIPPIGLQGNGINLGRTSNDEGDVWKSLEAKDQILYKHIIRLENLLIISLSLLGIINISLLLVIYKKRKI